MTDDSMQQIIQRVLVDQVGETIKGFYAPPYGSAGTAGKITKALREAGYNHKDTKWETSLRKIDENAR